MKAVTIQIEAIDRASPAVRGVGSEIVKLGSMISESAKKSGGAFESIASGLAGIATGLMGAVAGIAAVIGTVGLGLGAAAYAVYKGVERVANETDRAVKSAADLGVSVQEWSMLNYAAQAAGTSIDAVAKGMLTLNKEIGNARLGLTDGKVLSVLKSIGVSAYDANGNLRSMSVMLPEISDGLQRIIDPAQRGAVASALFGKSAADMNRILAEGGDRLKGYASEAKALNGVILDAQAAVATNFNDAQQRLATAWDGLWRSLMEQVGPQMTTVVNYAAQILASIPDIVRNVWTAIEQSANDPAIRVNLAAFIESTKNLFKAGYEGIGRIITGILWDTFSVMPVLLYRAVQGAVKSLVKTWIEAMVEDSTLGPVKDWLATIARKFPGAMPVTTGISGFIDSMKSNVRIAMIGLGNEIKGDADKFYQAFDEAINGGGSMTKESLQEFADNLQEQMVKVGVAADKAFHIAEAWKAHVFEFTAPPRPELGKSLIDLSGQFEQVATSGKRAIDTTMVWSDTSFYDGINAGLKTFIDLANDAEKQGEQLALGITQTIGSNVSDAIYGVISGTQRMAAAFRTAIAGILQNISQLIIQLLVVRAISAGLKMWGFGVDTSQPILPPISGNFSGDVLAGTGGMITNGGIRRFGTGGAVPGPNVMRDIVPAMLMPGEFVLSRRGVQAQSPATLWHANRGGRVVPEGTGGDTVNVNVSVAFSGATGTNKQSEARIGEVVTDAVLEAIERSSARRTRFRKLAMS